LIVENLLMRDSGVGLVSRNSGNYFLSTTCSSNEIIFYAAVTGKVVRETRSRGSMSGAAHSLFAVLSVPLHLIPYFY